MPIDQDFTSKLKASSEHAGHKVWGTVQPPKKLGIHGTSVAVDQDLCDGEAICVQVCPVVVFEMIDSPGHPKSDKKSDPFNESACIYCRACETQCPAQAIKITEK